MTATAVFKKSSSTSTAPTVALGLTPDGGGTLSGTSTCNGTETPLFGGDTTSVPVNMAFEAGTVVSVTASPADGYTFKGWYVGVIGDNHVVDSNNGTLFSSDATLSFTADAGGSYLYQAVFEPTSASDDTTDDTSDDTTTTDDTTDDTSDDTTTTDGTTTSDDTTTTETTTTTTSSTGSSSSSSASTTASASSAPRGAIPATGEPASAVALLALAGAAATLAGRRLRRK